MWDAADGDVYMAPTPFDEGQLAATKPLRVGFFVDNGMYACSPSMGRAVRDAAARLEKQGHILVPFAPPECLKAAKLMNAIFTADGGEWMEKVIDGKETPHRLTAGNITYKAKPAGPATELLGATDGIKKYQQQFLTAWRAAGLDVVICPAFALPAPVNVGSGADGGALGGSAFYTGLFNVLGYPAGVVPETNCRADECTYERLPGQPPKHTEMALAHMKGAEGMPIAVQVASLPFRDETVLRVMKALETEEMLRRAPPDPLSKL